MSTEIGSQNLIQLFGRRVIYSSAQVIDASNVVDELERCIGLHSLNRAEIKRLFEYYRGRQDILGRVKRIRPEINNRIVENHAYEIVSFKVGYMYGAPIQYIRRGIGGKDDSDNEFISEAISQLNEYMFAVNKSTGDKELGECQFVCGTAYRGILPGDDEDCPFEIDLMDPETTFIVYSRGFGRKPLMSVQVVEYENKPSEYAIYTPSEYFLIRERKIIDHKSHVLGAIPIIEYPANVSRLGAFEPVIGLLNALNNLSSNRLDGVEQFIQSFIKFVNCQANAETLAEMRELGAVEISSKDPGMPVEVGIVTSELNQTQVQALVDYLYQQVLIICGMPDREGKGGGADTGQAVMLRDGWSAAESMAREVEHMFKRSERQFLKIALRIIGQIEGVDLRLSDIEIKFTRNRTDNLLVKTQALLNQLQAGIHPQVAIANIELFSDSEQVYLDSAEYLEKWKTTTATTERQQTPGTDEWSADGGGLVRDIQMDERTKRTDVE